MHLFKQQNFKSTLDTKFDWVQIQIPLSSSTRCHFILTCSSLDPNVVHRLHLIIDLFGLF
jgi:hypothetical protein